MRAASTAVNPETLWVEAELVRGLMRTSNATLWVGFGLVLVVVAILWRDVPPPWLMAWALLAFAVHGVRAWAVRKYVTEVMHRGVAERLAFFNRFRRTWPATALSWGLLVWLYFERVALAEQFACWLVLSGVAMFSINPLSHHMETLRDYVNTLALTVLAIMLWRMGVELAFEGPALNGWLVLLTVIFRVVLLNAAERLHQTHRRNYELQYRNNQLIESLTRQTQAALDAVEIKNRFLASAAHDIRQPVHALGLYADWLRSEPELADELAPKIYESTRAVNALFDSLFDLARLDSGQIRISVQECDVVKLMHDIELQYRPQAESKGLTLRMRLCEGGGHVQSDPILLRRILSNLVSNAVKYTLRGGIMLTLRRRQGVLTVEVWDTGLGIDPVYQGEIFREFYKVPGHGGTEDGFGLGLYIVSRLANILGHPLSLQSVPGRGTVFRVRLDETDPAAAQQRAVAVVSQIARRP